MRMTKEDVAKSYLNFLENDQVEEIVALFAEDGIVVSPLYGTMPAKSFYKTLAADTANSVLNFDGVFYEDNTNRISLLFDYDWELKTGEKVSFKVVDIIELNDDHKINKLIIIYDTVHSRPAIQQKG